MKNLLAILLMLFAQICIDAQQNVSKQPVLEKNFIVNKNPFDRVVVTLTRIVGQAPIPFKVYDSKFRTAQINGQTRQLLLQAGQRVELLTGIILRLENLPQNHVILPFAYRIDGFYVPKPDLRQLPDGNPTDYLFFYEQHIVPYDGTPICWDGTGIQPPARTLQLVNLHFTATISISHHNRRKRNNDWQTVQIHPSDSSKQVGCVLDIGKYLDIDDIHFVQ